MLESLIITLREGVEAALVVGIIYAFLRREGLVREVRWVWAGLAAAVVASFAGAVALRRVAVNEEAFEGVLYLASAVIVGSMLVWMWRNGRRVAQGLETSLGRLTAERRGAALGAGLFAFTFLMVFREGVETVLFLTAVSLTTSGLLAAIGAFVGLALAVAFGVLFVRGSLRIDLGRFLKVTAIALGIFVLQLLVNGYHELAEAGWLPATPESMALIGPLVRHEVFFVVAIVALPLIALAVPGRRGGAPAPAANPAEDRLLRHAARQQRRLRAGAGALGVAILALLGFGFAYQSDLPARSPATSLAPDADGTVRVPLAELADGDLHRYAVTAAGVEIRFVALEVEPGEPVAAFDACVLCGDDGYVQQGSEILCLNCTSAVFPPSIGQPGGCNPIPLPHRVEGADLVVDLTALAAGASHFASGAGHAHS